MSDSPDSRLRDVLRGVIAECEGEAFADDQLQRLDAGREAREAREAAQATRHTREQRAILSRGSEQPRKSALPQVAKPPPHLPYNEARERDAERVAAESAAAAGRRGPLVYVPAWTRTFAARVASRSSDATRELGYVPRAIADSLRASARPFGGTNTVAGRNVLALGLAFFWLGKRLRGRLSGLPSEAWASLTVGPNGAHYGSSALFHGYHNPDGELDPHRRGPRGGRIGMGRNRGFVRALEVDGWVRVIVPDGRACPDWMVGPSGWPFMQILVADSVDGDTS